MRIAELPAGPLEGLQVCAGGGPCHRIGAGEWDLPDLTLLTAELGNMRVCQHVRGHTGPVCTSGIGHSCTELAGVIA